MWYPCARDALAPAWQPGPNLQHAKNLALVRLRESNHRQGVAAGGDGATGSFVGSSWHHGVDVSCAPEHWR